MNTITSQLRERTRSTIETTVALFRFLRTYISARLTPVLGDDCGEIASKLTATANNIQTP